VNGSVDAAFYATTGGSAGCYGSSYVSIGFEIGSESRYVYRFLVETELAGYEGSASFGVQLVHPTGFADSLYLQASSTNSSCCSRSGRIQRTGALEAGVYRLDVGLTAGGSFLLTSGTFTIHFQADILADDAPTWTRVKRLYRLPKKDTAP
jgi:hypothetical protein